MTESPEAIGLTWKQIGTLAAIGMFLLAVHTVFVLPAILVRAAENMESRIARHNEATSGPHQNVEKRIDRIERTVEKLSDTVNIKVQNALTKEDLNRLYQQLRTLYRLPRAPEE